ncbi:alpha/beta hydrolase [Cutibacterium sp. WCA-380-WT-3A]|uniref:Alpha/beta hydrolase n=1 Tax=Cutibacterium porci TaxID=2605781 RepID=A0A7K0J5I5_9ACTN|nr:alpha/beta hydrolase [Cutibacterium porci]MSS45199.1 alpha/beta hydrolase [Cutibacterium porci]
MMQEYGTLATYKMPLAGRPTLILGHGVTDNAASLCEEQKHWCGRYSSIAVDARGHGLSPHFSPEQMADPVGVMVDDLESIAEAAAETGPVILLAHSMGGAVAAAVAARRPDLVAALVLEEPAWLSPDQARAYRDGAPELVRRLQWMREHPADALAENRRDYSTWPLAEACAWLQGKIQVDLDFVATGQVCPQIPWREVARALTIPTLVVTSDGSDVLVGPEGKDQITSLGNAHLHADVIPGARHCVRREKHEQFMAVVDSFLTEVIA